MKTALKLLTLTVTLLATHVLHAANRYWIASSSSSWNSSANWSASSGGTGGAGIPGTSDIAIFDNNGLGNCSIGSAVSISGLTINSGYTGTITQGVVTVAISGSASISGGIFTGSGSTTNFNGGVTISGGSQTFNNVNFSNTTPWPMTQTLGTGTPITVNGTMTISGTAYQNFTGGTINLAGNLSLTNTATGGGGTTVVNFNGTGNQSITSALPIGQSALPSVTINKPSGTLTFPALITIGGNNWTYTAGTLDVTTNNSTIAFTSQITITGNHTLNNVNFSNTTPWPMTYALASGTTLTASGTVTFSGSAAETFSGGTIALTGNLNLTNTAMGSGGNTVLAFTGTGSQAMTSGLSLGQSALPSVTINKPSGTLTLPSLITMAGTNWTYTAGTIDATTNNSAVVFNNNTTITGSHTLNNIYFSNTTPWGITYTLASGTTLSSTGTVTLSGGAGLTFSGGTLNLLGNLNLTNTSTGDGGSTLFAFTGTANQFITSSLPINQSSLPSVNINKTGGTLTFPAILTMAGANWTYTSGTLDVGTNNSNVVFGGNTTITGSHTLNNVTFDNSTPWPTTVSLASGTTLTTAGTLYMSGGAAITLSGGTVNVLGNMNLANTSTGDGGSTVLAVVGTGNQVISSSLPVNQNSLPSVNINKASGTLTFPSILTMGGTNWTYTTGTIDATTNNSTVYFVGNTTITGSHSLNNVNFANLTPWPITYTISSGTLLRVAGNMTMSGAAGITLSGGTINLLGNLNLTNTSTGDGGSTLLAFVGTGSQVMNSSLPVNQNSLPSVSINKTSGTLTFPPILTIAGTAWTYTAGTVDAATNASTVYFTNNITTASNGMSFYNYTISNGTSTLTNNLTVSKNLTLTTPGVLSPVSNTVNLAGNWTSWSGNGFTEGTSTVNLNGSSVQTINTTNGEVFANLTINNSGSGVQLAKVITVGKTLTMTAGNIDLNGNNLTIGLNSVNTGTLAYTSGFMINTGSIIRYFKSGTIATGSAAGLFPVGISTDGRPFSVSAPTTGPTVGGTITLSYTDGFSTVPVSFPDGAATVRIRKNLNWAVTTGGGLTGGNYNLGISGTSYGQIGAVSDLRLTLVNSVVGTAGVNAGTTADPQVNRTALSLANLNNTFYLGSINPGMSSLPVTLVDFNAKPADGTVILTWTATLTEDNTVFTVQRSGDGANWQPVAQLNGQGIATTADYTATDRSPLDGNSYYRLMMTQPDGSVAYSAVLVVNFAHATGATISVYPNPVVSLLTIATTRNDDYLVTVVSELGQVMISTHAANGGSVQLNVSGLSTGIYFVRISGTGWADLRKIIVRR